jgi:pimeloyl-ACP methyl ester carboxylesterase
MTGAKALAVEDFCRRRGHACVRFDMTGHGASSGRFEDGTIGGWADDAVAVLDALTEGSQIVVGSSMGGWLMLLAALARPQRVVGLLGLAAAPDFTETLIFQALDPEQRQAFERDGQVLIDDCQGEAPYPISRRLIEEGRRHLLLSGPIALSCPVRLIHGQQDADVPWPTALKLADCLDATDVAVTLVKSAGHRLSEPDDIARMLTVLDELLAKAR